MKFWSNFVMTSSEVKRHPIIDFRANPLDLNNPIGFDRFSKSREVIAGSNFEKIEEKQV